MVVIPVVIMIAVVVLFSPMLGGAMLLGVMFFSALHPVLFDAMVFATRFLVSDFLRPQMLSLPMFFEVV